MKDGYKELSMNGQLSIFDIKEKKRPCEYGFKRYIGQKVYCHGIRTIERMGPYYTYLSGNIVGTPHDLTPVEGK